MSAKKQSGNNRPGQAKKLPPQAKKVPLPIQSFFDRPGKRIWYLFSGILALIGFIVFRDYLLFHKIFMFKDIGSDTLNTFYPNLIETSRHLKKFGTLSWSFNTGMGQDDTFYVFGDIFNYIMLLFPVSKIAWLLGYAQFIKIVLGGIVFCIYLRISGRGKFSAIAGALMFAFCGYMIVGGEWYVFSSEALNTAFVLLSFELLFRKNMRWLFPLPFFIIGITSPFSLYAIAVFLLIYTVFRYIQDNRQGVKGLLVLLLKMAGLGAIGIALSAPLLMDGIKVMLESARASGPNLLFKTLSSGPVFAISDPVQLGTSVARFFSSDMLWTGDFYKGWSNYLEGPLFYCGIPCLLLVPLLFAYLNKKQRAVFGIMLAIWVIPIIFPYFRRAFWLFAGDYYRTYSLYVAIVFIIFSALALDKIQWQKRMNIVLLVSIAAILILIQLLPYFDDKKAINANLATATKIYVLAYAAVLLWISRQKNDIPKFVFLAILLSELAWFSSISVNRNTSIKSTEWKNKTGYNDYTNDAVSYIKKREKSFYRIDKFYGASPAENRSLNDAMVLDYYSTCCYFSFNQKYYLQYMWANKVIGNEEAESRWCHGLVDRPILQSLNSVKYMLAKQTTYQPGDPIHDSVAKFGDVIVYKNKLNMPLGFCYDKFIKYSYFDKLSLTQKDFTSCRAAMINDKDTGLVSSLKSLRLQDSLMPSSFTLGQLKGNLDSLKQDTLDITSFNPAHITGTIELKSEKLMYLSIPYDIGWHLKVDGRPQSTILIGNGMIGVLLKPGKHEVKLDYEPPYRKTGAWLALGGLALYGGLVFAGLGKRKKHTDNEDDGEN